MFNRKVFGVDVAWISESVAAVGAVRTVRAPSAARKPVLFIANLSRSKLPRVTHQGVSHPSLPTLNPRRDPKMA
jgi:hypothetical protein